jgi:hypothetical protein
LKRGSCEKMIISIAKSGKSPLAPLFQSFPKRGTRSRKSGTTKYLPSKTLPSFLDHSPFEKGGQKGGFEVFHNFKGLGGFFDQGTKWQNPSKKLYKSNMRCAFFEIRGFPSS